MMTLTYPENYALLTMEEMTYTTGRRCRRRKQRQLGPDGIQYRHGCAGSSEHRESRREAPISSGSITGLMATVCGLGTTVLGYLNISSIGAIAGQIQKAYPEQYPEEGTTLNGTLIRDSSLVYFSSPIGALLGLANIGTAAGYVYCMLK